jgi:hypothetical protein
VGQQLCQLPELYAEWLLWTPVKAKLGEVVLYLLPATADKVQTTCHILISIIKH